MFPSSFAHSLTRRLAVIAATLVSLTLTHNPYGAVDACAPPSPICASLYGIHFRNYVSTALADTRHPKYRLGLLRPTHNQCIIAHNHTCPLGYRNLIVTLHNKTHVAIHRSARVHKTS
jgi:hypothetical protein